MMKKSENTIGDTIEDFRDLITRRGRRKIFVCLENITHCVSGEYDAVYLSEERGSLAVSENETKKYAAASNKEELEEVQYQTH